MLQKRVTWSTTAGRQNGNHLPAAEGKGRAEELPEGNDVSRNQPEDKGKRVLGERSPLTAG